MKDVVPPADPLPHPLVSGPPARPLPWECYRSLMESPGWSSFVRLVRSTRDYELGLRVGLRLLTACATHRGKMPRATYEQHLRLLYTFTLSMLDKGDRLTDYLDAWRSIREHTSLSMLYDREAREDHGERIVPYILGQDDTGLHVHFLYAQDHRRTLVERKLARRLAGKPDRTPSVLYS